MTESERTRACECERGAQRQIEKEEETTVEAGRVSQRSQNYDKHEQTGARFIQTGVAKSRRLAVHSSSASGSGLSPPPSTIRFRIAPFH